MTFFGSEICEVR